MSDLKQLAKPNADITDYEWDVTPPSVKFLIEHLQQLVQQKQKTIEELQVENQWLHNRLDLELDKPNQAHTVSPPEIILWATVGLILTIGGTFVQAYTINAPWSWVGGMKIQTLGVSYQIGAVLLTGCLGGKNAALLSQIVYVILGLAWLPIFERGGGWQYLQQPTFGYILGFIFGAWLCGFYAYQSLARLNSLALSCLIGFVVIHLTGITYLTVLDLLTNLNGNQSLWQAILAYSIYPLPGQIAVVCAVSLIALVMRKLMFS
ncbi:BioY protein [Stanieria cyanosphaera PCC 7437]|uniref:BioY protein n=1 Tax=Stanieria cyanosphaera (strain ATCC 29371 / PCC 7437) TaxID=111780 RepID=K9XVP0_STAC7|nr:biotin transporter BioY [Stanieria cyanosphaera]AFZ36593.1 BioY protein [Stanieria cyanosphaera PCC 7437]